MQARRTHQSSLTHDFTDVLSQHYIESIDARRKGITYNYRDANGLNVNKPCGYLVNPVVPQVTANCWSKV